MPENIPIRLLFDNYFTLFRLINHLNENNLFVTGKVRSNRIDKYPLHDIDKMEKKSIGETDYILDNDSNIISVKWNDNSVVTLLSSCHGVEPVKEAKRWSDAQKKHILIPQPFIVN